MDIFFTGVPDEGEAEADERRLRNVRAKMMIAANGRTYWLDG